MLHYLPGCDVAKNHASAVLKMKEYMIQQGAKIDQCCRNKEDFLTEEDTIVNNCTFCQIILEERFVDTECLSLYEYVLNDESFPWVNHHGEKITIQDCFRTRDNLKLQKAIRECLIRMNYTIVEMEENYEKTNYCGVWLNNMPSKEVLELAPQTISDIIKNHIHLLSPEEQTNKMQEWVKQYSTNQVLVYCNGCEKGLKMGGGNPIHMIELLSEGIIE